MTHLVDGNTVWKPCSFVKVEAKYASGNPLDDYFIEQTIFTGENIHNSGPGHDSIYYNHDGVQRIGALDHLLSTRKKYGTLKAAVERRLEVVEPDSNKKRIVTEFGHKRMKFHSTNLSDADVTLDVAPATSISKIDHIVPDYYNIATRYSIATRESEVLESSEERRLACLLLVSGVQVVASEPENI